MRIDPCNKSHTDFLAYMDTKAGSPSGIQTVNFRLLRSKILLIDLMDRQDTKLWLLSNVNTYAKTIFFWVKIFWLKTMSLIWYNQASLYIASNPFFFFYQRTNHIEIDCTFIQKRFYLERWRYHLIPIIN